MPKNNPQGIGPQLNTGEESLTNRLRIMIACLLGFNLVLILSMFFHPYRYNDDIEVNYFWMHFGGNSPLYVEQWRRFQPIGFRYFGDLVGFLGIPVILLSKLMTATIWLVTLFAAWLFARRLGRNDTLLALVFMFLVGTSGLLYDRIDGGHPRSWATALQLLGLALATRFDWRLGLLLGVSALLHPISFLLVGGVCGLKHSISIFRDDKRDWKQFLALVATGLIFTGVLMADQRHTTGLDGPLVTGAQHEAFQEGGRSFIDRVRPVQEISWEQLSGGSHFSSGYRLFFLQLAWGNHSARAKLMKSVASIAQFLQVGIIAICIALAIRTRRWPIELTLWLAVGLILYHLAVLWAFRLYSPDRYVFPLFVIVGLWAVAVGITWLFRRHRGFGWLALAAWLLCLGSGVPFPARTKNMSAYRDLVQFMKHNIPNDAVITGHPESLDPLPLFLQQHVVVFYEINVPWRVEIYEAHKRKARESLDLMYMSNSDLTPLESSSSAYLLWSPNWMQQKYLAGESCLIFEPLCTEYRDRLRLLKPDDLFFHPKNSSQWKSHVVYEDKNFSLIDLESLRKEHE